MKFRFVGAALAAAAVIAGCAADGNDDERGRFTPGEGAIAPKRGTSKECEAGVCSPAAEEPVAPSATPGKSAGQTCETQSTCAGATDLGALRGDIGGDARSRQGVGSQFFSVTLTEDRAWWDISAPMRLAVTLISPRSTNYDLFVYEDCAKATESSEKPIGDTDKITKKWGDSVFANASDDKKTLRIEVRKVSQTCDPDDDWTLLVQGNSE